MGQQGGARARYFTHADDGSNTTKHTHIYSGLFLYIKTRGKREKNKKLTSDGFCSWEGSFLSRPTFIRLVARVLLHLFLTATLAVSVSTARNTKKKHRTLFFKKTRVAKSLFVLFFFRLPLHFLSESTESISKKKGKRERGSF